MWIEQHHQNHCFSLVLLIIFCLSCDFHHRCYVTSCAKVRFPALRELFSKNDLEITASKNASPLSVLSFRNSLSNAPSARLDAAHTAAAGHRLKTVVLIPERVRCPFQGPDGVRTTGPGGPPHTHTPPPPPPCSRCVFCIYCCGIIRHLLFCWPPQLKLLFTGPAVNW